uniref:Beta-1,4-mannosyl-glycoprotein 4-beta-N-acetylglucosaminyltransferase n=1 Tax=Anopheles farauti TaxID=69004 RepID=A0A182QLJ3_9DIPT
MPTTANVMPESNDLARGDEHDDGVGGGQLLKGKLLHPPRHPKYRPWIQRDVPKPERAEKYFRTIPYTDWQGNRKQRLCFIEGTQGNAMAVSSKQPPEVKRKTGNNETEPTNTGITKPAETELTKDSTALTVGEDGIGRCRCNPQWHGADCGQPEVIWRAFITAKLPPARGVDQSATPRPVARNLFYIVQSTYISVEVLEIQLMELADQVSLFVLCDRVSVDQQQQQASFAHHLDGTDFLRSLHPDRLLLVSDATCSTRNMFRKLQKYTTKGALRADDIVLISGTDEILNRKAVAYLRWYDNWPQPVRFRLKHNVYGFFWQQPGGNSTVIGSAAVQIRTLREVYGSDPERVLAIEQPVLLIGDLNHFGGWYCRRCYQPGSIVQYYEHRASATLYLPDPKHTKVLNEEYVQQLIATGKDLENGERTLERVSRRTDRYYEPEYVRANAWKFDNIVLNLFARWDDNLADDDYFS